MHFRIATLNDDRKKSTQKSCDVEGIFRYCQVRLCIILWFVDSDQPIFDLVLMEKQSVMAKSQLLKVRQSRKQITVSQFFQKRNDTHYPE